MTCGLFPAVESPTIESTASNNGSGFSTMPGPPPKGASSTVLRSSVANSRNWTRSISSNPDLMARPTILVRNGLSNISVNNVIIEIFMAYKRLIPVPTACNTTLWYIPQSTAPNHHCNNLTSLSVEY